MAVSMRHQHTLVTPRLGIREVHSLRLTMQTDPSGSYARCTLQGSAILHTILQSPLMTICSNGSIAMKQVKPRAQQMT
jgi:hypothetical protein